MTPKPKKRIPPRKPPTRTGIVTGFQCPPDLLEWIDGHCDALTERFLEAGMRRSVTRTDVVLMALEQYRDRVESKETEK